MSNKLLDIQRDILEMIFEEVLSDNTYLDSESPGLFAVGAMSLIRFVICSKACYKVVEASKYNWYTEFAYEWNPIY
tara:strand:+ start:391 stop:618 length:228 start_codon:yes stop_codon:yes gene_type:complete